MMPDGKATTGGGRTRRTSLVTSACSNWVALAVNIAVGLLLTPFVITHVGQDGYGIWSLVGAILGCYGLLDLGVSTAVGRYVARYAAQGDRAALNETASTALTFFMGVGILVAGAFALLARPLGDVLVDQAQRVDDFVVVARLLGVATAVNLAGQVFRSVLLGHERFVHRNAIAITAALLRAGLTVGVLLGGLGLVGVAAVTLASDATAGLAYALTVRHICPGVRLSVRQTTWPTFRMLLAFGVTSSIIVAADLVRVNIDSIVIASLVSVEAVAIYHIAMLLVRYVHRFIYHGVGVLGPRLAGLHGQDKHGELQSLVVRTLWIASMLAGGGSLMLVTISRPFVHLWVGRSFDSAFLILAILAPGMYLEMTQLPAINALYAMNRHRYLAITRSSEAVANLALSVLLVMRYGMIGVAIGTLIPLAIVNILIQPVYLSRLLGLRLWQYACPIVACSVPALVLAWLWWRHILVHVQPFDWPRLILSGLALSTAYALGVFAIQAFSSVRPLARSRGANIQLGAQAAE